TLIFDKAAATVKESAASSSGPASVLQKNLTGGPVSPARCSVAMVFLLVVLTGTHGWAQPPATGTLRVTVVDPSSAVVPGATVTVAGTEDATKGATIAPVRTAGAGVAIIPNLRPG